jgi:hypothetical protein
MGGDGGAADLGAKGEDAVADIVPVDDVVNFPEESEAGRERGSEAVVDLGEASLAVATGLPSGLAHASRCGQLPRLFVRGL